jgi:hypothetical protein
MIFPAHLPLARVRIAASRRRRRTRFIEPLPALPEPTHQTLEVRLVGLNLRERTFEVRTRDSESPMTGKIDAEVFSDVSKAELPSLYRVVLETRRNKLWMISATKL